MASELDLITQLLAYEQQQAVRIATHQQVAIQPDALVLCPVQMAGEDNTMHAVAFGRLDGASEVHSVAEPRWPEIQFPLFEGLGAMLEAYFRQRLEAGSYPQVWVTSGQVVELLDTLSDRYRFYKGNPAVARFAQFLGYLTERRPVAGQQVLHTASASLSRHWATGMPASGDNLGLQLAWLTRAPGSDLAEALAEAERNPLGARTTPAFDDEKLQPRVVAFNGARRANLPAPVLARHADAIHRELEPVVRNLDARLRQAIALLQAERLPLLPELAEMEAEEAWRFAGFMRWLDQDGRFPVRDKPAQGARRLTDRVGQLEAEAGSLLGDRIHLARQELSGHLVRGTLQAGSRVQAGRQVTIRFDVVTSQRVLRLRAGDELVDLNHEGLTVEILSAQRQALTTRLSVEVRAGVRKVGLLPEGTELLLAPASADRGWLQKQRKHVSERLKSTPWTHDPAQTPPTNQCKPAPADPLSAIEAMR